MAGRLEGRIAFITGAASGIGAATARRFREEGARMTLADLDSARGSALAKELDAGGDAVVFRELDVRDREGVQAAIDATAERFGRLDVLFNNAGIGAFGQTPDLEPDAWHDVIDVDLNSVFYGCRAAIPHMRAGGGGSIVNTASISGLVGDYGLVAYNAAKGAVVNLTRTVAIDHAREGIRCNAVCPGPIETALTSALLEIPTIVEKYAENLPMGRVGRAEEVAAVVAFLASDDASYVSGANIPVDGGVTAWTGQNNFTRALEGLAGE